MAKMISVGRGLEMISVGFMNSTEIGLDFRGIFGSTEILNLLYPNFRGLGTLRRGEKKNSTKIDFRGLIFVTLRSGLTDKYFFFSGISLIALPLDDHLLTTC